MTFVVASEQGAALDSDLQLGGGTDDTTVLQGLLDRGEGGTPLHLMIDGPALVTGLKMYGNTTIEFTAGSGLFLADDSNRAILCNAHRTRDHIKDVGLSIVGGLLNGNRSGQEKRGPAILAAVVDKIGVVTPVLEFHGVEELRIEGTTIVNARSFGAWIANARKVDIRDISVDSSLDRYPGSDSPTSQREFLDANASNLDGLHFNGPVEHLRIRGAHLRTEDDAIALNANDLGSHDLRLDDGFGPNVGQGPITDVRISDVTFDDCLLGIRLLSSGERIDDVVVENLSGTIRHRMMVAGPWWASGAGDIGTVAFSDVDLRQMESASFWELYPDWREIIDGSYDFGEEADLPMFSLNSAIEELRFSDVSFRAIDDRPIVRLGPHARLARLAGNLTIEDPTFPAMAIKSAGGTIDESELEVTWRGGSASTEVHAA